jgi:CBS domain-containing protein
MDFSNIKIREESSVVETIATIDRAGTGVAAVVAHDNRLIGIITYGDIRRAILQNFDLSRSIAELQKWLPREFGPKPLSLPVNASRAEMVAFFEHYKIRHLPLLDPEGRLIAMVTHEELLGPFTSQLRGVIMAGGAGMRLRPLTETVPKPMLELRGKPIPLRLIEQYRQHGIKHITLVLHYKKELIQCHPIGSRKQRSTRPFRRRNTTTLPASS